MQANHEILEKAIADGDLPAVVRLITTANVNEIDDEGLSPLHYACLYGKFEICQFLLDNGAEIDKADPGKRTPLHNAASIGHAGIVKLLIEKQASIEAKDIFRKTPVERAIVLDKKEAGRILLLAGAKLPTISVGTFPTWVEDVQAEVLAQKDLLISELEASLAEKKKQNLRNTAMQQQAREEKERDAVLALCRDLEKKWKEVKKQEAEIKYDLNTATHEKEQAVKENHEKKSEYDKLVEHNTFTKKLGDAYSHKISTLRQELAKLEKTRLTLDYEETIHMSWQSDEDLFNQQTAFFEENKRRWQKAHSEWREAEEKDLATRDQKLEEVQTLSIHMSEIIKQRFSDLEKFIAKVKPYLPQATLSASLVTLAEPPSSDAITQENLHNMWQWLKNSEAKLKEAENQNLRQQRALELYPHLETLQTELKNLKAAISELQLLQSGCRLII